MSDTSLAGNFAVKEAYLKALKTGENIKDLRLLEVLRNDLGAPYLYSDDVEIQRAIDKVWSISMSHDNQYCVGIVLARNENH
jgi:holo-[acyl-carrier protein] synthase